MNHPSILPRLIAAAAAIAITASFASILVVDSAHLDDAPTMFAKHIAVTVDPPVVHARRADPVEHRG